ncbi:hypothetical protein [Paenibacillus sp. PK3_47]|uniref:hypothetical protein n=1 Tax=Paenibacillus sp. PK3_47 TaxID=2072642 RepID=UPI00201DD2FD|nr:hypothetical protein [Paenibacillus sp. PK3_47]
MKILRMLLPGLVMLLVLSLVNFYIGIHLWVLIKDVIPEFSAAAYWTVFIIIAFAYMIGMVPWPQAVKPAARFFKVVGSYYLACMEFAIIVLPLTDLLYWVLGLMGFDRTLFIPEAGAALILLLAVFLIWGSRNAWSTVVRNHPIRIHKTAGSSAPLTVAVASDLHLGNIVGNRHLGRMVREINSMQPDIIGRGCAGRQH